MSCMHHHCHLRGCDQPQNTCLQELRAHVEPLLAKYGVRAAFHGHDHNLEHVHVAHEPMHYFVSGAGSKTRSMEGNKDALFQHPANGACRSYVGHPCRSHGNGMLLLLFVLHTSNLPGFMAVVLHADHMLVEAYGLDAVTPLYTTAVPLTMTASGF